jgi:hypothetical protein
MSEPPEFNLEAQRDYLEAYATGARRQRTISKVLAAAYTASATGMGIIGAEAVTSGGNLNRTVGSILLGITVLPAVLAKEAFDDITEAHDMYIRYLDLIDVLDESDEQQPGEEMF